MKVIGVLPRSQGSLVKLEDGTEAWTPGTVEEVQAWGGTVPAGFELRDGKRGKVLVEKKQGGAPAYRNTKEAFEAEARSRSAWQREEEDRKDRRTALMTAFEWLEHEDSLSHHDALFVASDLYRWLQDPGGHSVDFGEGSREATPATGTEGEAEPSPSVFPVDPTTCEHKTASGAWVRFVKWKVGGEIRRLCPKCGMDQVSAMEGTSADLGPAISSEVSGGEGS